MSDILELQALEVSDKTTAVADENTVYKNTSYHLYKISYILAKTWGILAHYLLVFTNLDVFLAIDYIKISLVSYFAIHLTQLYFIFKIITGYFV